MAPSIRRLLLPAIVVAVFLIYWTGSVERRNIDQQLVAIPPILELQRNYSQLLGAMDQMGAAMKAMRQEQTALGRLVHELLRNNTSRKEVRALPPPIPSPPCANARKFDVFPRDSQCPAADEAYARKMAVLADLVKTRNPATLPDWDPNAHRYAWDYLPPIYHCPNRERIGRFGDGGKQICDFAAQIADKEDCVVYSFGVDSEVSFEIEILLRTKCKIYAFDHTIGGFPDWDKHQNHLDPAYKNRIFFHRLGFGAVTGGQFISLPDVMKKYNHKFVDILKVDIEQAEWDVFAALATQTGELPVGQLSIELHLHVANLGRAFQLFSELECLGLRPFMHELNINPCTWRGRPFAIEYSFINPRLLPCSYDFNNAVELYKKGTQKRSHYLERAGGPRNINPWDTTSEIYLWDWFPPLFNCPFSERLGGIGTFGRYVCNPLALSKDSCVAYSFGAADGSFELDLLR
eukprot:TRINITY_DN15630_c1_g1_i2.p2 TRINITY_DN15630_c1_g1~~TRINITY_DN15630_c1_g1_i2.p2  ORF type:complete len:462 (-),score=80.62 TRINITY_DN15630_c1_g1_i2:450-1835(-)